MQYRPEIDGLRAVAVLPVILFHSGLGPGGGYVGVDVFFVISGYLITGIILEQMATGRFNLLDFYERRARRILPALFLVMLATLPAAWALLVPRDMVDYAQSLVAVATFSSNILFWREAGYFAPAAELKPLLHTWSLAVEEQYYILFPLLLMALARFGARGIASVLAGIALASLILAEIWLRRDPGAAFYLLPFRTWELLAGALAAVWLIRAGPPPRATGPLALLGLGLIAAAVALYDEATPFPGVAALLPVTGTLLIILFAWPGTAAQRILGLRPLVGVGLISYSAYLWHQPLFAFARHGMLFAPSTWLMLGLSVLSLVLAWLSWRFVELPFRHRGRIGSRAVAYAGLAGAFGLVLLGLAGNEHGGFPDRYALPYQVAASFDRTAREPECYNKPGAHERPDWSCRLGDPTVEPSFFLLADSHGLNLLDPIDASTRSHGIAGRFAAISGCTPLLGLHALRANQHVTNCHAANARAYARIAADPRIDTVILAARWSYYTDGGYGGEDFSHIAPRPDGERSRAVSRATLAAALDRSIDTLRSAGKRVVIVPQIPQQRGDAQSIFYRAFAAHDVQGTLDRLSVTPAIHHKLQFHVDGLFAGLRGVSFLDLEPALCDGLLCRVGTLEASYYHDGDHLSVDGTRLLTPLIDAFVAETLAPDPRQRNPVKRVD